MRKDSSGSDGGGPGRHRQELCRLQALQALAARGQRQLVLLTGEAGTGKTGLIDEFLSRLHSEAPGHLAGRARCRPGRARREPYRPLLEALGQPLRALPDPAQRAELIRQIAPSWQIPLTALLSLAPDMDWRLGATLPDVLPQELADLIDLLGELQPLTLVLEDMQWGDQATLDLIGLLAGRRSQARVMTLVAYRASDAVLGPHSLRTLQHQLVAWGQAQSLSLDGLTPQQDIAPPALFTTSLGRQAGGR